MSRPVALGLTVARQQVKPPWLLAAAKLSLARRWQPPLQSLWSRQEWLWRVEGLCLALCDPARATIMKTMADKPIIVSEMPFKVRRLPRLLRRRLVVM